MTKEMYNELNSIVYGHYVGEENIPKSLIAVAEKTINEPDSEIKEIEYALEAWVLADNTIELIIVGKAWSNYALRIYDIQYDLGAIDEDEDENSTRRYDLVTDIEDLSEVKR